MEVLVAVIILGFSMSIVYYVIQNTTSTQCVEQLQAQTTQLQNAMLDVALGSPPTKQVVTYNFPSCGSQSVQALRFVKYTDPAFCRLCPGQYGSCWLIEPTVFDTSTQSYYMLTDASVCVNMPAAIQLDPIDQNSPNNACQTDQSLTQHFSQTPCGPQASSCSIQNSDVPASVYGSASSPGLFETFGRKTGDPTTFVFELDKVAEPSQAGIIQICVKKSVS